ncbi:MAG: hypothetical protein ACRDMU_07430 [Gaiellaceae bacterium]
MSRVRLLRLTLAGLAVAAIGGAVAAYGFYALDWRCPDEDRLRTPEEVERAFADERLDLVAARTAVALPAGARIYRHESEGAMVYVLVCRRACNGPDTTLLSFTPTEGPTQFTRYGVGFVNVQIWTTDADRSSERRLRGPIHRIVDEKLAPLPPDRCYIA